LVRRQEYRWVFWSFGMVTFLPIVYLYSPHQQSVCAIGGVTAAFSCRLSHTISAKADAAGSGALYGKLMTLTVVAWVAYPVVWAIGEGAGVIDETIEVLL
jgi:bacteriorhodopsin